MELEQRGIPAVAIATTVFMNSANAHAKAYGRADYESVEIQHPISGRPKEEIEAKADVIVSEIVRILTGAPKG